MSTNISSVAEVEYPDSDGEPMSDNTVQFAWIQRIAGNLEAIFRERPEVFVAGNLLWYAVIGRPEIRIGPDVLVAFDRPKGDRGSYRQWEEAGIPPHVVFEIRSPGNRQRDLDDKFLFYERYGVEEYYLFDPDLNELEGWHRSGNRLIAIPQMQGWVSPRLNIRFDLSGPELEIYRPDGQRFLSFAEKDSAQMEAENARCEALSERDQARQDLEKSERQRIALAERLRQLGIDPDSI